MQYINESYTEQIAKLYLIGHDQTNEELKSACLNLIRQLNFNYKLFSKEVMLNFTHDILIEFMYNLLRFENNQYFNEECKKYIIDQTNLEKNIKIQLYEKYIS